MFLVNAKNQTVDFKAEKDCKKIAIGIQGIFKINSGAPMGHNFA